MSRTKGSGWGGGPLFYQIHAECGKKKAYYNPLDDVPPFKCTWCNERFHDSFLIRKTYASQLTKQP